VTKHRRHVPPIPDQADHPLKYRWLQFRWRLAVAAVVYPVQIAVTLALLVCAVPVYLVLQQQATIRHTAEVAKSAATGQRHLVEGIQASRVRVAREICGQLDRNARTVNAQLRLYQGIIVGGAKQSRVFDRLYRQYGAPPYRVRVRQAAAAARRINALRLPLPNCNSAITSIQPQPPPVVHGNP
jgi:hypothetical protein